MKAQIATLTLMISLGGCVSISSRAQNIQLFPREDPRLMHCERLGHVSAEASGLGQLNLDNAQQQAKNNLLDAAAARWPGSVTAVELRQLDNGALDITAVGVAFRCKE